MPQLICRVKAFGNHPQICLARYGQLRAARSMLVELKALTPEVRPNDYRLLVDPATAQEAALSIRKLVNDELLEVLWTDCEPIRIALQPDPELVGLAWCVKRFKEDHRGLWTTFWEAHGACSVVSNNFFSLLRAKKVVSREQVDRGEAGVYEGPYAGAAQGWHAFPYVGRIVIDWTYRQIDGNCKIPHIYRLPANHKFPKPYVDYDPRAFEGW